MPTTNPDVDEWSADQRDNPLIDSLQLARQIIMEADDRVEESIKWKTPTFAYQGNIVSFTLGAKNFVSLMFHKGGEIPGDHSRLEGDGKQVRTMRFDDADDLTANRADLEAIIRAWCESR
jgi:hypothetical protein